MSDSTEWYWDLERKVAVSADERGPGDHTLGPYRTKGEAENWKSTVEARNESWDEKDEEWSSWGDDAQADDAQADDAQADDAQADDARDG